MPDGLRRILDDLIDQPQACAELDCSRQWLWARAKAGDIKKVVIAGRNYYSVSSIRAYVDRLLAEAGS